MPKISNEGGPTYYGHQGEAVDAVGEHYEVNPVRDDAEVRPIGEPGQDPNEAELERREREEREASDQESDEDGRRQGGAPSVGNSSKESSAQRAKSGTKTSEQNR